MSVDPADRGTNILRPPSVGFPLQFGDPAGVVPMMVRDENHPEIQVLLSENSQHRRAVAGIDRDNTPFVYSGDGCVDWYGSREGEHYSVQGNMLVGEETISAMAEAFEGATGFLGDRLIRALEAGQTAGGDKRGRESAALLVAPLRPDDPLSKVDIRVDQHEDPVAELRRIGDLLTERYREVLAEARELQARKLEAEKS